MQLLYRISNIVYVVFSHIISYRKKVVIQNLSRSFPEKNYEEIEITMKKFYHLFCDNLVEILKSISISPTEQTNKITLTNINVIQEQIALGKNIIVSMGHCGNWEILNILPYILDLNCYAVYKPLKGKLVNRLFIKLRSRFGMQLVPAKSVARHFISNKNNPSVYFFLADQCPKTVDEEYQFDFLHQKTSVFSGIEKLAYTTNSAVVYLHVIKTSRGMYKIECKDISIKTTDKRGITPRYIQLLEQNIQEQPYGWLWTHKRWKR